MSAEIPGRICANRDLRAFEPAASIPDLDKPVYTESMTELLSNPGAAAFWLIVGLGISLGLYIIVSLALEHTLDRRGITGESLDRKPRGPSGSGGKRP